jgi:hypothetical protein
MMKRWMHTENEKGQSLVELALSLVFLLIMLAGVVDLGRAMYEYLAMRDAAQEGAGYGSIFPNYCAEIKNRTIQNLPDSSFGVNVYVDGASQFCEAAPATSACEGKEIIVAVDHNFSISMPFLSEFTGSTVPMHVEIKDRIVRPSCPTP